MKKPELARRVARETGVAPSRAADRLDRVVQDVLRKLRRGEAAEVPGLGKVENPGGGDGRQR